MRYLICGLVLGISALQAGTINFYSDTVGEWNNQTGTNVLITAHPVWFQPGAGDPFQWVSFADTGDWGTVPVDNDLVNPRAIFTETIEIPGILPTGSLSVWADDTAGVYVNDVLVYSVFPTQDAHCAGGPIGCEPGEGAIDIPLTNLVSGTNIIRFEVYQRGGGPFGLVYYGNVDFQEENPIPEPGTYVLVGLGLTASLFIRRFRERR